MSSIYVFNVGSPIKEVLEELDDSWFKEVPEFLVKGRSKAIRSCACKGFPVIECMFNFLFTKICIKVGERGHGGWINRG